MPQRAVLAQRSPRPSTTECLRPALPEQDETNLSFTCRVPTFLSPAPGSPVLRNRPCALNASAFGASTAAVAATSFVRRGRLALGCRGGWPVRLAPRKNRNVDMTRFSPWGRPAWGAYTNHGRLEPAVRSLARTVFNHRVLGKPEVARASSMVMGSVGRVACLRYGLLPQWGAGPLASGCRRSPVRSCPPSPDARLCPPSKTSAEGGSGTTVPP